MAFRYPEHPNTNRRDPFKDGGGRNPFADVERVEELDGNPYASSPETQQQAYEPTNYVASGHGRGRTLLILGGLGFGSALIASIGVLLAVFGGGFYLFISSGPLLLGAAASSAAWLMARNELRMMQAGAMSRKCIGTTQAGLYLGMLGTLLSAVPIVLLIVSLVQEILAEL